MDESPSRSSPAHQATEGDALSQSTRPTKSEAGSHVHVNETQDTSPVAEKGSKDRPDATRPSELPGPQARSSEEVRNVNGVCPSSCPSNERAEPAAPVSPVLKGIRRRWKQESPECTSAPPTGVEPSETSERSTHKRQLEPEEQIARAGAWRGTKRTATKHSAAKSKAVKPLAVLQSIAESLVSTPETNTPGTGSRVVSCGHTGLASLAETPAPTLIKADPYLTDDDTHGGSAGKQASPMEVTLGDDTDVAGLAEADLKVQSEQRAMQELYRFQKLSLQAFQPADAAVPTTPPTTAEQETAVPVQPPVAPPISLYANLPSEWPLARISVWMRHISVLLRVTLYRRLAELSFRGVDFKHLPREVVKNTQQDFDTVCGAMASQLAALFAFLQSSPAEQPEGEDLALYADPSY